MPRRGLDRAAVVAAAATLVDAEGPEALTLARLAERLQVRLPSLYNHIAGLADLRTALAALVAREMADVLRTAALGRAGAAALSAMADAYRAYARAHPGRYTAAMRPLLEVDDELRAALGALMGVVEAVLAASGITGADAIHLVRAFRVATEGFTLIELSGGFQMAADVDESFRRMIDMLIAGAGLASRVEV